MLPLTKKDKPKAPGKKQPVVVLYGSVGAGASESDQDTLEQVRCVSENLMTLGYPVEIVSMGLRLDHLKEQLKEIRPGLVFNLVESVGGRDALLPLAPVVLDGLAIPYTGAPLAALVTSGNKLEAKRLMALTGIPTTETWSEGAGKISSQSGSWIVKSVFEQASFGMDDRAVTQDAAAVPGLIRERIERLGGLWFAEKFVSGREFNVSLLANDRGVEVLPIAEIRFQNFPKDKPKIVGYAAKWDPASPEYKGTVRGFDFSAGDSDLLHQLSTIALDCWRIFGLRGYARVDFRVDDQGQPLVLEVNANPCLSPDAGFAAAAARKRLPFQQVIQRIVRASQPLQSMPESQARLQPLVAALPAGAKKRRARNRRGHRHTSGSRSESHV